MTTRRTDRAPGPPRLAEQADTGDPTVDRAARLFRQLQAPPSLHPAVEARIDRGLAELEQPTAHRRARWPVLVGAGLLLFGSAAVAARYTPAPLRRLIEVFRPPAPAPVPRRRPPAPPVVEAIPAPEVAPRPRPAPRAASSPPRRIAQVPVEKPAPPPPASPSALAGESALLGRALGQLRREGNPTAALATLDEYESQFPRGVMAFDVLAARVEALVKLGRTEEALARLDSVPAATLAKSPALRVVRGELRAGAGRLAAAVEDFEIEVERARGAGRGDLFERALYGRGSSRARQGDSAGAREDLERYLHLYPHGRFSGEARRVLGR